MPRRTSSPDVAASGGPGESGEQGERPTSRGGRRKASTRAALITAARQFLAEGSRTDVSIQEITDRADVGFGSFYNHFSSKAELFGAAVAQTLNDHGQLLDALTADLEDPAEVFAVNVRHTGRLPRSRPELASVLMHTGLPYLMEDAGLAPRALRDIHRATESGRFIVRNPSVALVAAGGALLGLLQLIESSPRIDVDEVADELAVGVLCLLGLPREEAVELCARPLPTLPN
ncbi:MAG TPA: TetR/AcrR family transcriptional regulator [Pseudonocardia sp.]|jgi:AcrR family transcriptional regulator|nr:TetR/AcrR family transcriptional regulator [Pseudonocardia sp.]